MSAGTAKSKLSHVCKSFGRGKAPKYVDNSPLHVINQACIYWDGLRLENVKFQNQSFFKEENILKNGSVLLNSTGTGTIGRAHVFNVHNEFKYMADSHVTILIPDEDQLLPEVLQYYLYNDQTQDELYRMCVNGSTSQAELSKESLGRMLVPIIDFCKQKKFVELVHQADKSKFMSLKFISNRNLSRCLGIQYQILRDGP